jgi:hypothetical protein
VVDGRDDAVEGVVLERPGLKDLELRVPLAVSVVRRLLDGRGGVVWGGRED